MASKVKIINKEELQKLHTGTLMKRRESLLACEESFNSSDRFGYEDAPSPDLTGVIEFKDTETWEKAYSELKEVLSTREHWPNKTERKVERLKQIK